MGDAKHVMQVMVFPQNVVVDKQRTIIYPLARCCKIKTIGSCLSTSIYKLPINTYWNAATDKVVIFIDQMIVRIFIIFLHILRIARIQRQC